MSTPLLWLCPLAVTPCSWAQHRSGSSPGPREFLCIGFGAHGGTLGAAWPFFLGLEPGGRQGPAVTEPRTVPSGRARPPHAAGRPARTRRQTDRQRGGHVEMPGPSPARGTQNGAGSVEQSGGSSRADLEPPWGSASPPRGPSPGTRGRAPGEGGTPRSHSAVHRGQKVDASPVPRPPGRDGSARQGPSSALEDPLTHATAWTGLRTPTREAGVTGDRRSGHS